MATEVKPTTNDSTFRPDHQKTGGRISTMSDANSGSDMASDITHKAKEAGDTIKDKTHDVGHSMQDAGHTISEKYKDTHKAICDFTKENPTSAVLIAFGLGAILARILPGR